MLIFCLCYNVGSIGLGLVYCSSLVFSDLSTCNCIERFLSFTVTLTLLQYFKRELASVIRHTNVNRLQYMYMYSHVMTTVFTRTLIRSMAFLQTLNDAFPDSKQLPNAHFFAPTADTHIPQIYTTLPYTMIWLSRVGEWVRNTERIY